ncbi:MAG: CopG family transcriptional regulator [Pseudomonadota bacterium]
MKKKSKTKATEINEAFDRGGDVLDKFDVAAASRPNEPRRINLELPQWMLTQLDIEAARLGVPRQAIIKFILDEKLKKAI